MGEPWPYRQRRLFGPTWIHTGSRCPARGCSETRQAVAMVPRPVADDMGPQGAWKCGGGHVGWIWPAECSNGDRASRCG